jgi:acetyl-CoA carboxylase biotin carboxylase subunit
VRIDAAIYDGYRVPPFYDSLVSKLVIHGNTRADCLARSRRALDEYVIEGIQTTIPLHQRLLNQTDIQTGHYDIHWLERFLKA